MLRLLLALIISFVLAVPVMADGMATGGGGAVAGKAPLTNTHVFVGDGTNTAQDVGMSGDAAITNAGAVTVTKTNGSAFAPSATTDTTNATNITSGTLTDSRLTSAQKASAFGGDGSGGALNLSATETTIIQYNGTTVSVADGATETLKSGSVINATSTITIGGGASGVLTVAGINTGGAGGAAAGNGVKGKNTTQAFLDGNAGSITVLQLCGGNGAYTLGGGGGAGGSFWGTGSGGGASGGGGSGGSAGTGLSGANLFNNNPMPMFFTGGTGGGGAGGQGSSNASNLGGSNAGKVTLCAVGNITVAAGGTCNANGGSGAASTTPDGTGHAGGGGGGGPGGVLCAYSLGQVIVTGTMTANGGNGGNGGAAKGGTNGNGGGGGGAGAGGIALRMSTTAPGGAGTYQANAGSVGSAGAKDGTGVIGVAGSAPGGAGNGLALSITGSPNFPLIVMHQKYLIGALGQIAELHKDKNGYVEQSHSEHCSLMAALECEQRNLDGICFQQMHHHFMTNTEWVPNNAVAILNDPSKVQAKLDDFTCETLENPEHGLYCGGLEPELTGDHV